MRNANWVLLIAGLLLAHGAAAEDGARWDDSHMQSRHQDTPSSTRVKLSGESGYSALASGSSETTTTVPEAIEYTSQRQWVQGSLSTSNKPSDAAASGGSSSSGIQRGSSLRAGSVHSRR